LQQTKADGFYINTDQSGTYIKCTGSSCTVENNPGSSDACNTANIGKLTNGKKLCLNGTKDVGFLSAGSNAKNYLVSYVNNGVFTTVTDDHYGIVSVTANSMTLNTASSDAEICASDSTLEVTALDGDTCSSATQYSSCTGGICQKYCKVKTGANCKFKNIV